MRRFLPLLGFLLAAPAAAQDADLDRLAGLCLEWRLHQTRTAALDDYLTAREASSLLKALKVDSVDAALLARILDRKVAHFELEKPGPKAIVPSTRRARLKAIRDSFEPIQVPDAMAEADLIELKRHLEALGADAPMEILKRIQPTRGPPPPASAMDRYRYLLRHQLFVTHTPESLLEFAIASYERTKGRLEAIGRKHGKDWRDMVEDSKAKRFTVETLHAESEKLAIRARDFAIEKGLATIPESAKDFGVAPAPADAVTPFGHYRRGSRRGKGTYVTAPISDDMAEGELLQRLRDNNLYWTAIVSLHEAVPGHHLQHEVIRTVRRPALRRAFSPTTYIEGWGLYVEEIMARRGYFKDDPLFELTLLRMRLWRCARIVIDVGLQTRAMTRTEAERLLVEGVRMEPVSARSEVGHYQGRPTYFCGYLLGYDFFIRLRERCASAMGDRFEEKNFHDAILRLGPLPMAELERLLLEWAEKR